MSRRGPVTTYALLIAAALAGFPLRGAAVEPGVSPPFWCRGVLATGPNSDADSVAIAAAGRELCAGHASAAADALTKILPAVAATSGAGPDFFEYRTTYLFALIAAHKDDAAQHFLHRYIDGGGRPEAAERDFLAGDFARSFAEYVADDDNLQRSPDLQAAYTASGIHGKVLADVRAANVEAAIAALRGSPLDDRGASLELLLRGNLFAQARRWPEAFEAWAEAAESARAEFGQKTFPIDKWNEEALDLLYAYRSHAPSHPPAERLACGAPADLADVESAALAKLSKLDASSIVDAEIVAGGPASTSRYAEVTLQTKGAVTLYFAAAATGWTPIDAPPPGVVFASPPLRGFGPCASAWFVNRPSGP